MLRQPLQSPHLNAGREDEARTLGRGSESSLHSSRRQRLRGTTRSSPQGLRQTIGFSSRQPQPSLSPREEIRRGRGCLAGEVNRSWRFYFVIRKDEYVILSVIPHPKQKSASAVAL